MPELPEVETMRRGILPIVGATIVDANRTPCGKRPIAVTPRVDRLNKRVAGRKIKAIERLGKRVVVRIDSDERIIFEPRMTGLVLIEEPPTQEHLRFRVRLKGSAVKQLLFWDRRGLGNVSLLSPAEYQAKLDGGSLGPDALDVSQAEFSSRFKNSRREIKVAMLDQAVIAGVGNLYASEILHQARIDPRARCHRLNRAQWERIFACMIEVLETAIQYEGSTLSDGTYRNALNQSGGYQNEHLVYDRTGELCSTCRTTTIKRIVQAQRATFFCPRCQRKR
jgi:formamidopyrimidine-DNA glycosylase